MALGLEIPLMENEKPLTRWRMNSPFIQNLLLGIIIFCGPGVNTTVLGLGAGGSRPSNIPVVDRLNILVSAFLVVAAFFGGSVNNQIGPRYTLMLGTSSYPLYVGSLWWLDTGKSPWFTYLFGAYHGIGAGLFYTSAVYINTSYSPENYRGKYVASSLAFVSAGSMVGSVTVLGIVANSGRGRSHVTSSVYIAIIAVQCLGFLLAACLTSPAKVRRNDNQAIALFPLLKWSAEIKALPRTIFKPWAMLLFLALLSCQMPLSLVGSLNAFYFNARTRALVNLCFWTMSAAGSIIVGLMCDGQWFGLRRRRAVIVSALVVTFFTAPFAGLLHFLNTHDLNRHMDPPSVDWSDGGPFVSLLVIYVFLGIVCSIFQGYVVWLCSTFSNEPIILSRYSGYIEALKALGLLIAYTIDSNDTPFLTEAAAYLSLAISGMLLAMVSAVRYTKDTKYGQEDSVIVPQEFEVSRVAFTKASIDYHGEKINVEVVNRSLGVQT